MENVNNNNLDKQNPSYGSVDADSGNHPETYDKQINQNSELKKQPSENDSDSNNNQTSDSYKNEYEDTSGDDDLEENENEEDENEEEDEDINDQDLDENGFPRSANSSFPSNI
jgi:hypothetical protein